jgi:hypothetical protein
MYREEHQNLQGGAAAQPQRPLGMVGRVQVGSAEYP